MQQDPKTILDEWHQEWTQVRLNLSRFKSETLDRMIEFTRSTVSKFRCNVILATKG